MIYTVWYRCALCGDELAESRDVEAPSTEVALWRVPQVLVHDSCNGSATLQGIGVCQPMRVVL